MNNVKLWLLDIIMRRIDKSRIFEKHGYRLSEYNSATYHDIEFFFGVQVFFYDYKNNVIIWIPNAGEPDRYENQQPRLIFRAKKLLEKFEDTARFYKNGGKRVYVS